jgi:hypothetical protein
MAKFKWNTEDEVVRVDAFNDFMIKEWAFIRDDNGNIVQNYDYPYSMDLLYKKFKEWMS